MLFQLNTTDGRPIYAQIADQVKNAVAAGLLRPGELIPSVRELSKQLVVNPNTVARAYRDLQGQTILESVRGTGLQVAAGAPLLCRDDRQATVRRRLREALDEARRSNLPRNEIEAILHEEWGRGNGDGGSDTNGTGVVDERG
ncbi:GntR family transcriptional regulator [Singulisphaera sp. GP187]|uniref:GntR family transcriptional regulator n=1 Tax=Singulisphaera sp. GP187 TaxID=1882752 RepID=UPI00092AB9F7|nr:GntR family transcriptional regulator [Singulisphaera sp. GP187]SIN99275.1 GntR family transcriptional regulator [Singulisphaera sp. GP187]